MVFSDPPGSYKTASSDASLQEAYETMTGVLNSNHPNRRGFRKRGGKLIVYHGWSDAAIAPENTIDYFQKVGYKPGPSLFGQFSVIPGKTPKDSVCLALETWVEKAVAPGRIIATNLKEGDPSHAAEMTRPLCPNPEVAKYKGPGDTNVAASFECEVGK